MGEGFGSPPEDIMRTKKQIENDGKRVDLLILEVLLDIRDMLKKDRKCKPKARSKQL